MKLIPLLWKLYFVILTLMYGAGHVLALMAEPSVFEYPDILPSILGLAGLYGYAFHKAILRPLVWQVVFVIVLGWTIYFNGYVGWMELHSDDWLVITSFIVAFLIMLPHFLALYLYGFRAEAIWGNRKGEPPVEELSI